MSKQAPTYKRRSYFVKKDFQVKFILKFCLIVLIGAVISSALLLIMTRDTLTSSFHHSRLTIENTGLAILPDVIITWVITLILITLATAAVILFISHKIAGPLFRLEQEVKDIGKGDLTRKITLREKDQVTALANGLTEMAAKLNKKVLKIRTGVERLIKSASEENAPRELIDDLNALHTNIKDNFKL
ncbi:MAG: HAMP domain-containing protein [Deltaproteobacteria bacterium]|nr:HAMP domain-containing protein [Deltaproteobacteria bacterium]